MIPTIRLFAFICGIKSNTLRRAVMVLVAAPVLVEYLVNAVIRFVYEFRTVWNAEVQ